MSILTILLAILLIVVGLHLLGYTFMFICAFIWLLFKWALTIWFEVFVWIRNKLEK